MWEQLAASGSNPAEAPGDAAAEAASTSRGHLGEEGSTEGEKKGGGPQGRPPERRRRAAGRLPQATSGMTFKPSQRG